MKIGRNDPCPCGSGRKYKKCCLKKNGHLKGQRSRGDFWDRFEYASYAKKIGILEDYLSSSELDGDHVFDMLSLILKESRKRRDYDTFAALVRRIREEQPEIYRGDAPFYGMYLAENMVLKGDFRGLSEILEPLAEEPDRNIDGFSSIIELLMYHGKTDALIPVMAKAYPKVMASEEIIPPGKDEFSTLLGWFIIFKGLKELNLEGLYTAVSKYWDIGKDEFEMEIRPLVGGAQGMWKREDFLRENPRKKIRERVLRLSTEFMHEANKKGMGYARALLARNSLVEYLLDGERFKEVRSDGSLLIPESKSLDRHLAEYINPFNNLPYRLASLTEALPFYLEFLYTRKLIEREEFERCLESMHSLKEDVLRYLSYSQVWKEAVNSIEKTWKKVKNRIK